MNKVVALPDLVEQLSAVTGCGRELGESFVKELFSVISEQLADGESVEVDGLGVFRVEMGNAVFTPCPALSSEVNSAFECFEPVELDDDMVDSEEGDVPAKPAVPEPLPAEGHVEDEASGEDEPVVLPPPVPAEDLKKVDSPEPDRLATPSGADALQDAADHDEPGECDDLSEVETETGDDDDEEAVGDNRQWYNRSVGLRCRDLVSFLAGIVFCLLLGTAWYFFCDGNDIVGDNMAVATAAPSGAVEQSDTVAMEAEIQPAAKDSSNVTAEKVVAATEQWPKYYKVDKSSYLSAISRQYYGHHAFWIYIYIENKDKIDDPDHLPVGISLEIPDPAKYGIDKDNPESVKRAQRKTLELFG